MGKVTEISWCDSSLNLMMGCDGCELAARGGAGTCYAEVLTNRWAKTSSGYPDDFYTPKMFPHRLADALKWSDLTGKDRPEKPWMNGLPRHIFLDDMGDTFTESLPLDWIAPHIDAMEDSPHTWMFLTKRPARMRMFFEQLGRVPRNFLLGTSVTSSSARVAELMRIPGARRWVSAEPLLADVDLSRWIQPGSTTAETLVLVIAGAESGPLARHCDPAWIRSMRALCAGTRTRFYVKQLGPSPLLRDRKGADWDEWPKDLRVRQMPAAVAS